MERLSKSLRQLKSLLVYHMSFFYTNLAETFKNQWCLEQTLSIQTISVMIILDYKPKGFVLVIFFFMENENMQSSVWIAVVLFRSWIQFLPR